MDRDVTELTAKYTYGTWRFQKGWKPLHVTKAEGVYFWDKAGKRYLDLSSQLMCTNLGHQNPAVVEAICKQAREMAFLSPAWSPSATPVRKRCSRRFVPAAPRQLIRQAPKPN